MDPYATNTQYQPPAQPQYGTAPTYQGPPAQPQYGTAPMYQGPPAQPQYGTAPMNQGPPAQPQYGSAPMYQGEPQPQYKDPEFQNNIVDDLSYLVRKGFIVKTYGILLTQLALTCAFIAITFIPGVKEIIGKDVFNSPVLVTFLIIFIIVTITVVIVFSCCRETARTVPINYILLFAFTLSMSFYCLLLCSLYDTELVLSAGLLTFGATVGLTFYAVKAKTDYTYCGAFLFALLFILILSFCLFFWVGYYVFVLFLGILVYSLYIIYDTQLIIGNKTFSYNVDDYCLAALNLYIDIIYMFIKILQLLAYLKGK